MIYAVRIRFKPYLNPIKLRGGPFQMVISILSALMLPNVIAILSALILQWNLPLILIGSLFIFDSHLKV